MVKNPPAMQETWVQSLGWEDPWRRAWQPTPVFLPGKSPGTEEPGGLQSMGSPRVGHDWAAKHHLYEVPIGVKFIRDFLVVAKGCRQDRTGSCCLMGVEFQFYKMKRALEMDGRDGCTKMWIHWTVHVKVGYFKCALPQSKMFLKCTMTLWEHIKKKVFWYNCSFFSFLIFQ